MTLPLGQYLIPEYRFPIPFHPFKELEVYQYYDGPVLALVESGKQKYIALYWDEDRVNRNQTFAYFPINDETILKFTNNEISLFDFEISAPYMLVMKTYFKDIYPSVCWRISPLLVDRSEFADPEFFVFDEEK